MLIKKINKSNQEQAVASWINYLNQLRLNELTDTLANQDINLETALNTLRESMNKIQKEVIHNGLGRGGKKGMHGFIAEIAEVGVGNARQQIVGKAPNYIWINDNGPSDLIKDGVLIQQKFVNSGNHLSLQAIQKHLQQYPDYLKNGGKYQIPEDHYKKIVYLLNLSEKEANKIPTSSGDFSLKQWKEVNDFFNKGEVPLKKIEPSILKYKEVQHDEIEKTFRLERGSLRAKDKEIRKEAYIKSKPTFQQGVQATILSAGVEGSVVLAQRIYEVRKSGKKITQFSEEDWMSILKDSGYSTIKGGVRGATIYTLTNYTATPAFVASAMVTTSFSVAEQANGLRKGRITEEEFLLNTEVVCLETSISALSSFIGQAAIPIPILGAVIGNTVGMIMYNSTKGILSEYEQRLIVEYCSEIEEVSKALDEQYALLVLKLQNELEDYFELLDDAFSVGFNDAFEGSIKLARFLGVDNSDLVKNEKEIDDFIMN